jgi:hypothetical protein
MHFGRVKVGDRYSVKSRDYLRPDTRNGYEERRESREDESQRSEQPKSD